MSDETTIAAGVDLSVNVQSALKGLKAVESSVGNLTNSFKNVSVQVDTVIQKIESLTSVAAKSKKAINNTRNDFQNSTFSNINDFSNSPYVASSATGASMASRTGRDKAFKDFQQAQIEETKAHTELTNEIKEDTKERKRLRAKRANSESITANAALTRANKLEDQSTVAYKERMDKLAEAKLLNAKANQAGALLRSPRYQFGRAFEDIGGKLSTTGTGGRIAGDLFSVAGATLKAPAAGAALAVSKLTDAVIDFSMAAVQAYSEIESIKTQLGVVFSSQTQADSLFRELSQYAVKSPFGVQQTAELATLLKQSGVYASDLMDTLKMIGDTAGGNMEKMKRIANNYAQIVSIGKASMLDMRQFAYAGIPIFEAVSKELKVSQSELRKLISDGKITSDIIEKVFKDLTGVNGVFKDATEIGAKTLKARLQNLSDAKQLAMSEVGSFLVNAGTRTGNDSFVNNIVTGVENIYQWLHDFVNTKNIERDVSTIEKRESKIQSLESLLKLAERLGDNDLSASIKKLLEMEVAKQDYDKERAAYVASYQSKQFDIEKLSAYGVDTTIGKNLATQIDMRLMELLIKRAGLEDKRYDAIQSGDSESEASYSLQLESMNVIIEELRALRKEHREFSEKEIQASKENNAIEAQSLAYDKTNKMAGESDSLNSLFQELFEMWRDSDEEKARREEEHVKKLKAAQEELQKISKNVDKNGVLNATVYSREEFMKLWNSKAFTADKKYTVAPSNNPKQMKEDREPLLNQYQGFVENIISDLKYTAAGSEREALQRQVSIQKIEEALVKLQNSKSDIEFYRQFANTDADIKGALSSLERIAVDNKALYENLKIYLDIGKNRLGATVGGQFVDTTKNKGKELGLYTPLWKRIAANATGWDASLIGSSGKGFIDEYSAQAARNIVSGGIQGLVASGAMAGDVLTRMRYSDTINKQGVRQIDWKKTESDMISGALSMKDGVKMSAAALGGLSKALNDQVSVYETLTSEMISVGEDWGTINSSLKGQFANNPYLNKGDYLDSAFQASANPSDRYSLGYDTQLGLIVKENGELKGSLDNLSESTDKNTELGKWLATVKVDTIVAALDQLRMQAIALNDTVGLANSIAQQADEWNKQSMQTWGKALGGSSGGVTALLNTTGGNGAMSQEGRAYLSEFISQFAGNLFTLDTTNDKLLKEYTKKTGNTNELDSAQLERIRSAVDEFQKAGGTFESLQNVFEAMEQPVEVLAENAERMAKATKGAESLNAADDILINSPLKVMDSQDARKSLKNLPMTASDISLIDQLRASRVTGNSYFQQGLLETRGYGDSSFGDVSKWFTELVLQKGNENKYKGVRDSYKKAGSSFIAKELGSSEDSLRSEITQKAFNEAIDKGNLEDARSIIQELGGDFDKLAESANASAMAWGNLGTSAVKLGQALGGALKDFTGQALSSTFETWGKAIAEGADSAEAMQENFKQLGSSLMQNMGTMITQAGLAMIIGSGGDKAMIMAGIALAAAGAGASFLGGMLSANKNDENKEDDNLRKLMKLKEDLTDLLKQAREDAIYYENTLRHKNALSANESFTTTKVNDAIITPSGNVITTHPDDYLIATKTPQTLVGSGAPTINFSVIDKSTGIQVTKQTSTYNKEDNSIDFTAIIESKVQEIIATSKGDEAFAARQARINGRKVIA